MTTENSNLATPVESVGNAEDVQNVTIELNEAAEQVAEQNVEEQSVVEAADFAEEDAALDAEQAGACGYVYPVVGERTSADPA